MRLAALASTAALTLASVAPVPVLAQPTSTGSVSLQGKLTGVADGNQPLTFFLHTAQTAGTQVASVGPITTQVTGGVFSATVPIPASTFDGRTLWWSVSVNGGAATARQLVTSVPYAASAEVLGGGLIRSTSGKIGFFGAPDSVFPVTINSTGEAVLKLAGATTSGVQISRPSGGQWQLSTRPDAGGDNSDLKLLRFLPSGVFQSIPAQFLNSNGSLRLSADGSPAIIADANMTQLTETPAVMFRVFDETFSGTRGVTINHKIATNNIDFIRCWTGTISNAKFVVHNDGSTETTVLTITGGSDLAEGFQVAATENTKPVPGMVMVIDRDHDGKLAPCRRGYDTAVAGVVSGANGLSTGMIMGKDGHELASGDVPLAMTGRVWVLCDADAGGPIGRGDRLTTCETPGHAMRVSEESKAPGSVIGKAMSELKSGRGFVLVLVNLQ